MFFYWPNTNFALSLPVTLNLPKWPWLIWQGMMVSGSLIAHLDTLGRLCGYSWPFPWTAYTVSRGSRRILEFQRLCMRKRKKNCAAVRTFLSKHMLCHKVSSSLYRIGSSCHKLYPNLLSINDFILASTNFRNSENIPLFSSRNFLSYTPLSFKNRKNPQSMG